MTTDVWFVMLPGVLALDMTGPAETFSLAGEAFRLHYIGPDAEVPTSIGLTMGNIAPLPDSLPEGSLLVLPGVHQSAHYFATPQADTVRHWLMRLQPLIHSQKVLLMCVCSGSLLAAKAGLMTGIQCTTHHDVIARLRAAAPAALVKENRIFIEDRGIWTSAGITSGIDLTLHIIHRLCGPETALAVAREMVVWFRRSGDDPQLSPWLRYRNHLHPAVHRAQDALSAAVIRYFEARLLLNHLSPPLSSSLAFSADFTTVGASFFSTTSSSSLIDHWSCIEYCLAPTTGRPSGGYRWIKF